MKVVSVSYSEVYSESWNVIDCVGLLFRFVLFNHMQSFHEVDSIYAYETTHNKRLHRNWEDNTHTDPTSHPGTNPLLFL
jgi:hypothetical protein